MKFTKRLSCVWLVLFVVVSSGCQYMPKMPSMPSMPKIPSFKDLTGGADDKKDESETNAETIVRLPNPYLEGRSAAPEEALVRFEAAKLAMKEKNWTQAQADLDWLIENYPKFSGPYLNLALLYRQLEQPKKAEKAFKRSMSVNSKNVNAYNQYAIFLREQGRFSDARVIYLKALEVWPDHPESHRNLGILYDLYMGRLDDALPYYKSYQSLLDEPDRTVAGWIADTERRVKQAAQTQ